MGTDNSTNVNGDNNNVNVHNNRSFSLDAKFQALNGGPLLEHQTIEPGHCTTFHLPPIWHEVTFEWNDGGRAESKKYTILPRSQKGGITILTTEIIDSGHASLLPAVYAQNDTASTILTGDLLELYQESGGKPEDSLDEMLAVVRQKNLLQRPTDTTISGSA